MRHFGLIGESLEHSFSKKYFSQKFKDSHIDAEYLNFELDSLSGIKSIMSSHKVEGFNVTIPYKEEILHYVDEVSQDVKAIGAANCIKISDSKWWAFNTDHFGFKVGLGDFVPQKAAILGSGGASRAVVYALQSLNSESIVVSRKPSGNQIGYDELNSGSYTFDLIVNCSPVGTYPDVSNSLAIEDELLKNASLVYDLVYNPPLSLFLNRAKTLGTKTVNGQAMLQAQAEKSWDIWNSELADL